MAYDRDSVIVRTGAGATTAAALDEGLRAYMLKVYNYMGLGVALTGATALAVASSSFCRLSSSSSASVFWCFSRRASPSDLSLDA